MSAELIEIADALVAELNRAAFTQEFTAARVYLPQFKLEDMDTLHVTVVPKNVLPIPEAGTRAHQQHDFLIDVAIQKRPETLNNAALDPLVLLVQEIADAFRAKRLPGRTPVTCRAVEYAAIYLPEHLEKIGQFTSVLTLTFRRMR